MPRKQIGAADEYPLSTMEEMQSLNRDTKKNGGGLESPTSSIPSGSNTPRSKKHLYYDDDDDEPVKDLLVYYAKNSSMHGVPTIVGSELYRGRHIFWIVVVCVMAILLGAVVYWQMKSYYEYPTVTSVDIHYVTEEDFPAITVCDLNIFDPNFIKHFLKDNYTAYHLTRLTEITGFYHRWSKKFFSKIPAPAPGNVSSDVHIQNLVDQSLKILRGSSPLFCSWGDYYWEACPAYSFRLTDMGLCTTINVRDLPKKKTDNATDEEDADNVPAAGNAMRGLTLYLDISSGLIPYRIYQFEGFKIVLHDPDEEPLPLSSGFLVGGNTMVEAEISKTVKTGLPPPFKAFGSGTCVDTESSDFINPLHRYAKYSKEICEAECFVDFVVETCGGCRHFLHPGNESICPVDHLAECYRQAEGQYYGGHGQGGERRTCECPMPCKQSVYKASVTTSSFSDTKYFRDIQTKWNIKLDQQIAYVHFYYSDPVVSKMRQVAVYSTEGLLGNIGGQIGLFMGFSLITVAEMLELIFLLVTRGRNLDERVKRHKESEAAVQAAMQAQAQSQAAA